MNKLLNKKLLTNHPKTQRGFTLIEILVVLVIIGLLASFLVPKVLDHVDGARQQTAEQNVANISQQLKLYRLANYTYPTTEQGLHALVAIPEIDPIPQNYPELGYIEKVPMDPWQRPFQYRYPGKHKKFDLWSLGPDGLDDSQSTEKDDITNWE